ncbi:unnamed protein product [Prorocentrum cordatum]|uniref:Uncharacterized protein n=1 Tax=Prorocentrum cordatum TaxID=2364126 RepID=A0ABN9XR93_9DINO|nr:unnamed protein product [Polarella glacialis]
MAGPLFDEGADLGAFGQPAGFMTTTGKRAQQAPPGPRPAARTLGCRPGGAAPWEAAARRAGGPVSRHWRAVHAVWRQRPMAPSFGHQSLKCGRPETFPGRFSRLGSSPGPWALSAPPPPPLPPSPPPPPPSFTMTLRL